MSRKSGRRVEGGVGGGGGGGGGWGGGWYPNARSVIAIFKNANVDHTQDWKTWRMALKSRKDCFQCFLDSSLQCSIRYGKVFTFVFSVWKGTISKETERIWTFIGNNWILFEVGISFSDFCVLKHAVGYLFRHLVLHLGRTDRYSGSVF